MDRKDYAFLRNCFPDLTGNDIESALSICNNNVESASDYLLSHFSLHSDTDSTNSDSEKMTENDAEIAQLFVAQSYSSGLI